MVQRMESCRIINVSSLAHAWATTLNTDDLNFNTEYYGQSEAYAQTKLCNILLSTALTERFKGTGLLNVFFLI